MTPAAREFYEAIARNAEQLSKDQMAEVCRQGPDGDWRDVIEDESSAA